MPRVKIIIIILLVLIWPAIGMPYYGLYGVFNRAISPYNSYGYPYYGGLGWSGNWGLNNLYSLSGLYNPWLYGLGNPGWYGLGNFGLYGLGLLGLSNLKGLGNPENLLGLGGSSLSNGLTAYGLQLLTSGGLSKLGLQTLFLSAMFSSPTPEVITPTEVVTTNTTGLTAASSGVLAGILAGI